MGAPTAAQRTDLDRRKRASVGQLLLKAARLLNEQALARARARTGFEIRPAHTSLFPHIDLAGSRMTEIAKRMGISKQAVGQLVGELEEMGALERVPDPEDGRAKLVRFTQRNGQLSLIEGMNVLAEFETELTETLGADVMSQLHTTLARVIDALDSDDPS